MRVEAGGRARGSSRRPPCRSASVPSCGRLSAPAITPRPRPPIGARHHEAMLEDAAAERERAEDHRQRQADLVDDRRAEEPAGRRRAAPAAPRSRGNGQGTGPKGPWPSGRAGRGRSRTAAACAAGYKRRPAKLQHYIDRYSSPLPPSRAARRIGARHGLVASRPPIRARRSGPPARHRQPGCWSSPPWSSRWSSSAASPG